MRAVLPGLARPMLEPHLPDDLEVTWFMNAEQAKAGAADAEIAWIDLNTPAKMGEAIRGAGLGLKWVSTIYAGLDAFPLDVLRERGIILTNGVGINAIAVAEYAVMGVLVGAKRFDEVLRAHDRHEWLQDAPGKMELEGSRALIVGLGAIGRLIATRLEAFGVEVTGVTRTGREGTLTPDAWRARLGDYDWVILAAPSTADTKAMIGADELAAMKPTAWLINIARGDMINEAALVAALESKRIGGAFLDPTSPEPLPMDNPLWSAPNCIVTAHLSGRSQTKMFQRSANLFLQNLAAYRAGVAMENVADLEAGY